MLQNLFLKNSLHQGHALSCEAFRRLRIFTAVYGVVWLLIVVSLWVYWFELSNYVSWFLAILVALFVPDLKSLKIVTENYAKYQERIRSTAVGDKNGNVSP